MLLTMVGLIAIGTNPMAMMVSAAGFGLGMWGAMLLPLVGLLGMLVMMAYMFRRMTVVSGRMHEHRQHMSRISVASANGESDESRVSTGSATRVSYNIPAINCGGCKRRIEGAVGAISGVESVEVDVDAKQAILSYRDPATSSEVEAVLAEIGYPGYRS
jgi:copper chaperone